MRGGPLVGLPNTRRAFWLAADRQDYEALVPERAATAAYGLLRGAPSRGGAAAARGARSQIPSLPPTAVPVLVSRDPDRVYAAQLAVSQWRELGLGPFVRPARDFERTLASGAPAAWFDRLAAPYPLDEALFGRLLLTRDGRNPWLAAGSQPERLLRRALAARDEEPLLRRADDRLQAQSAVVPLAYAVGARLVSRRLRGWRQDALGAVDYPGSEPGPRPDAGDVEAAGRDRRDERADRVALVVDSRSGRRASARAREAGHVRQQLRHGDREAQVDERLRDLAVADRGTSRRGSCP